MSFQPQFPGMFTPASGAVPAPSGPDNSVVPATEKQVHYALALAAKSGVKFPKEIAGDRAALSAWIDAHKSKAPEGRFGNYPSAKQVAFAERIARLKRCYIPQECFRDKTMMSRWIDSNKPR